MNTDLLIDRATLDDVPAVLALANWAAEHTAANFATSPEPLADWVASWQGTHERYPWLVARQGGSVVGFAKASAHRARHAYDWTAEVSVYVDPAWHGRGVGRALYALLISTLRAQGYVTLLAGVVPPNPASERLHERAGFVRCGTYRRAGWKFSRWHDVVYFERHLWPAVVPPQPTCSVAEAWPAVRRWRTESAGLEIRPAPLRSPEAASLIKALNGELAAMYPEPGANHFTLDEAEVSKGRGAFLIAHLGGAPAGCGAVRTMGDETAELKRMFVVPRFRGLGLSARLLGALEAEALRLGVKRVVLETGERQTEALSLYEKAGYVRTPRFGEYVDSPLSVCLAKRLGA
jgi:putative acetyltransferase